MEGTNSEEQFLTSDNIISSLAIVKSYMLNEIKRLSLLLGYEFSDYTVFSLPENINELPNDTQHKLISIQHLCESIVIIDSKIGDSNV